MPVPRISYLTRPEFRKTADLILSLGILVALVGGGKFYLAQTGTTPHTSLNPGPITERQLAIDNALRTGSHTYSYETRFTPGIGQITDPEQYKKDLLNKLQTSPLPNPN